MNKKSPPMAADGDAQGCVLVWHMFNGAMVLGWRQVETNPFVTHWQRMPEAPEDAELMRMELDRQRREQYGVGLDGKIGKNRRVET